MPRRHKVDKPVTRLMLREDYFQDPRSFVSLPDGDDCESHVFLYGEDWKQRKILVWRRDDGRCQICGKDCEPYGVADPDHIVKRSNGGSDDMDNLRTVHRDCHEKRHPEKRVRFGESKSTEVETCQS